MSERVNHMDSPGAISLGADDGADDSLTGADAGTVRDERDHEGRRRSAGGHDDAGATDEAAHELARENEDEPTRSE